MSDAPWLDRLIQLEGQGFREVPGPSSNPRILEWSRGPGAFPDMTDDSTTPWCGIGLAGIMDEVGLSSLIPPLPFRAASWMSVGFDSEPRPGAIVVFPRQGGNHVTVIRSVEGHIWRCIGCNQSNAITTTTFDGRQARACRWPGQKQVPTLPALPPNASNRYTALIRSMKVRHTWVTRIDEEARRRLSHKERYKVIERATGIPWAFVAALHYREDSTGRFDTALHNGDKVIGNGKLTYRVPAGRGPFETWEDAAIDALQMKGFHNADDWNIEAICERAERYNGLGYRTNNLGPSPYLWSGTTHYERGKYDFDGHYNATLTDAQIGVIPLITRIMELDNEGRFRDGSRKLNLIAWVRRFIKAIMAAIGSIFTLDNLYSTKEFLAPLKDMFTLQSLVVLAVSGIGVWVLINTLDRMMMEDGKDGRYVPSKIDAAAGEAADVLQEATDERNS